MPFIHVITGGIDPGQREILATRMNQEFIDATGFEDEILTLGFSEIDSFAVRGQVIDKPSDVHFAILVFYGPRLRFDVKRNLVAALTRIFQELTGDTNWQIEIYIQEFPYDNIGTNGQLLTDADEELASRPFYYVLPH
jgi:phenylpyruvate tautomerase PptA (4-oxalocrotonate tautomerase family)